MLGRDAATRSPTGGARIVDETRDERPHEESRQRDDAVQALGWFLQRPAHEQATGLSRGG